MSFSSSDIYEVMADDIGISSAQRFRFTDRISRLTLSDGLAKTSRSPRVISLGRDEGAGIRWIRQYEAAERKKRSEAWDEHQRTRPRKWRELINKCASLSNGETLSMPPPDSKFANQLRSILTVYAETKYHRFTVKKKLDLIEITKIGDWITSL